MNEGLNHDRGWDLPIVKESDDIGELGLRIVADAVAETPHIFRPTEKRDFGIDGQIEIVATGLNNRHATGRLVALQIKCGRSYLRNDNGSAYTVYCSTAHANYWRNHSLPVLLVLCDPDGSACYWVLIDGTSLMRTPEGAKITVPKANRLAESGDALIRMSMADQSLSSKSSAPTFVFPLDTNYGIDVNDEELQALCAEVSLALSRSADVIIDVGFSVEDYVVLEAGNLGSVNKPTPADRKRLVQLESMLNWFSAKRSHLTRGLRMLFAEEGIRAGYLDITSFVETATAARAFVQYYFFERVNRGGPTALHLVAFPDDGSSGLIAHILLDKQDRQTFLAGLDTHESTVPLQWPGYSFGELGYDLVVKRGIPAVITAILFYADRGGITDKEIWSDVRWAIYGWQLRLA
jgi:hypothetical protein